MLEKLNDFILDLALSAKGYNNYRNLIESGEHFFVKKYLSDISIRLCFDVGATNGSYTRLLLEETSAKVVSFEPLPFVYDEMVAGLSHFSDRCTFVNKGIGSKSQPLTIYFNHDVSSHASFSEDIKNIGYISNSESLDIDVITLDDYCDLNGVTEIDFLKIDTEGFEKEVLEGASATIENIRPKFIQIEYNLHQMYRNTALVYFAGKLSNYNVYQLTYNGMRRVDPKSPYSNIYMFSNFVFIRKDYDASIEH